MDGAGRFSVHQLQWNDLPQSLPPLARRQMIAMYEDGVRPLDVVGAQYAYVVDERHPLVLSEPDEVDYIGNDDAAVVFVLVRYPRVSRVVQSVIYVEFDVDALKYDSVVVEHYAETHAICNERSGDQHTATSSHA